MNAIVLCAGMGMRLRPLTELVPKPLVKVGGCTLLLDVLHHLSSQGVETAVVNGSWRRDVLKKWLEVTELPLETIFQPEDEPLGTAGAVRRALPHLGDEFLVVYGDNLTRQPLKPLLDLHSRLDAEITIALSPTCEPSSKGIVLTDPVGRVTSFREKPPDEVAESNLANSGIYICRRSAIEDLKDGEFCDFGESLFPRMLKSGKVMAADTPGGYTIDIGSWRNLLLASHHILSGSVNPYVSNPSAEDGILIENDQDYEGIELSGTFWAEKGSVTGEGCFLENCVLLSGSTVGKNCRLKNTIVKPDSRVPDGTEAEDKYLKVF